MHSKKIILKQTIWTVTAIAMLISMLSLFQIRQVSAASGTDLYVGYSSQSSNFKTVQEAVNKAAALNPSGESQRVTIHIAPGTYREQVIVQTPYITFVNDEPSKGEVLLTWYYGIGYKYYSCGSKGYYDTSSAKQTSVKNTPSYRWGATVQLWPKAAYFKAKNITFENSFNRYITAEEIKDGVELVGDTSVTSITQVRTSSTDARSKAATERGAALSADAAYCEFMGCKFYGSQDTLYTGGSPEYYKNCFIEGNTDYIFGDSSAVFDSCELSFYGYSDKATGGYITAARDDDGDDTGYLFNNCKITANSSLKAATGYLGRPWRDTAKVMFINTTLANSSIIAAEGWTSMSGVLPESVAGFKEYGTKLADGTMVSLSSRKGHTLSASDAASVKLVNYMKNWTPTYLSESGSTEGSTGNTGTSTGAVTKCGGWFEEAFAEWDSKAIGSNVSVSYKQTGSSSYTKADASLIRNSRVDIPGLKANTSYDLKIEGSAGSAECTIKTLEFDRSGYAHWNYSEGVGAYNNDGTPKSGVTVIYVTNSNKDTITYGGKTGLYNIFYSAKPKNVIFRFIGNVGVPSGVVPNNGTKNDGSNMLYLQYAENVTIEGIGYDAALDKWGFEIKRSKNIEVRNLHLAQYPDDGISMTGDSENKSTHIWIHNNTILSGYNAYAGNGTVDEDKAEGDGSTDIKWSEYITVSYNYYEKCHKTSLVGGGPTQFQDWITYHHNWFNSTESRNPRARNAHIHLYNNYFKNNSSYGIGASYNSKIFSESNYFSGVNHPLDAEAMGSDKYSGTIKSYNDVFDSCQMGSGYAYKIVSSRTEKASISNTKSGGDAYDNFDLDSSKIYSLTPEAPAAAKTKIEDYAGAMQNKAYNAGTSTGSEEVITAATFVEGSAYMIKNVNSGLYMEVKDASAANNANVQQWGADVSALHNTWRLFDAGNGYYYIVSELADGATYALDVAGKKATNGTNIGIYKYNGGDNQQFKLTKNADGSYKIRTKVSTDKSAIEIANADKSSGANVQEWEVNGVNCQDWSLEAVTVHGLAMSTDVYYTFKNVNSGLAIEVKDAKMAAGTNVQQWTVNGEKCQKWQLKEFSAGGDYYYIRSVADPNYVLKSGGSADGDNISIAAYSTKDTGMLFKFAKNLDGSYSILTYAKGADNKVVEVASASKTSGANVQLWAPNGNNCQKWNVVEETIPTEPKPTEPIVIKGDLNKSGSVTVEDIVILQKYLVKKSNEIIGNADINDDKIVNVYDLILLKRIVLSK